MQRFPDGRLVHQFHYDVIKLWEYSAEELLGLGMLILLPFLPLTRDGKRPEVVKQMIDRLVAAGTWDLLAIARVMGGLVFTTGSEQEWFKRRFHMFQDVLRESWVYQEIGQEFLEKGREEGLQHERQLLISLVQRRFPTLVTLAEHQAHGIQNLDALQAIILQLFDAQGEEEAKTLLSAAPRREELN